MGLGAAFAVFLAFAPTFALAGLPVYGLCQYLQGPLKSLNILAGCPPGTLFVSAQHPAARFRTVGAALEALPDDLTPCWLLIDAGEYEETLNISRKGPITLLGATSTLLPHDHTANLVTIFNKLFMNQTTQDHNLQDNADISVLNVAPNKYAAWTGLGFFGATPVPIPDEFGTKDFRVYNVNLENRAVNHPVGPALALNLGYVRASFYGCALRSWQDTIFIGKNASAYFVNSQILGQTDFIYGYGTAWFANSTMGLRGPGGYVTAWKGTADDPTLPNNYTNKDNLFGAYFWGSRVVKSPDSDPALDITGAFSLGRPWNNLSRAVYQHTYMDESIKAEGFSLWTTTDPRVETIEYAEYDNSGPGWMPDERIWFDTILTKEEARRYSLSNVFDHDLSWIDFLY
ncbi:pectin lyase fold/virulence factor [Auriculariales sp. MPI-PUGE-AT-0066]|nr:pectin lyase fold/virulence factor [Auriculariales sp. MPI-PUGE-AT-0066]